MMKKRFNLIILFVVCFISVSCSKSNNFDNALLWKISGNGLDKPSYVLGTHHLISINFLDSVSGFQDAFDCTERVIGEVLASPEAIADIQLKIQKAGVFAIGDSYQKILSPEDYKRLDEGLEKVFGTGIENFKRLKPGLISTMVSVIIYASVDSTYKMQSHEPVDLYIQRLAREQGKATSGLETVEDQLYVIFESESQKYQAESLICALENMEKAKEVMMEMNRVYKEKSLSGLYNLVQSEDQPCPTSLRQMNALGRDRNNKWLEKLPGLMKEKPNLIAVGAMHLAGKEGLLYQLDKMGYTVEPVD